MYVTQAAACSVPNSTTPISDAQLAASAARAAAQDQQFNALLQKWMGMIDRTPQSFQDLKIAPSQFQQPQSAAEILNLSDGKSAMDRVTAYRAGARCNPDPGGPAVVPLNGTVGSLPVNEPVNLLAAGPLGKPEKYAAGMGCACGGTCGHCGDGMGDFTGPGSGMLWASLAAGGFLIWATLFNKPRRR